MDMHQIQLLGQEIHQAIVEGMRDGFATMEKPIELRDFFAGCAMHAVLASTNPPKLDDLGLISYQVADAVLLAREGKNSDGETPHA